MSTFNVTIFLHGIVQISTEADGADEAIDKAISEIKPGDLSYAIERSKTVVEQAGD